MEKCRRWASKSSLVSAKAGWMHSPPLSSWLAPETFTWRHGENKIPEIGTLATWLIYGFTKQIPFFPSVFCDHGFPGALYARLKRRLCARSPLPLVTTCLCVSPQDWQVIVLRFAAFYLRCEAGIGGEEVYCYGSVASDSSYIAW